MGRVIRILSDKDIYRYLFYCFRKHRRLFEMAENHRIEYWLADKKVYDLEEGKMPRIKNVPLTSCSINSSKQIDECINKKEVILAGKTIFMAYDKIDWMLQFDDSEDMAAYHRFMWLYRDVFENVSNENRNIYFKTINRIICSWIDTIENMEKKDLHHEVWQTYTVAERIVNWMFLLGITSDCGYYDEKIVKSVIKQANYIQENLEYYGERFTGNHLTNDAKALYIVGALLRIEYFKNFGKMIIKKEYERVIFNQGFLREGSSHYQLLFTKWYTDLYWISIETHDMEFTDWIKPRLTALTRCCDYFLYYNNEKGVGMPFFGDISPDHPPYWIMGVPAVARKLLGENTKSFIPNNKGYHSLFGLKDGIDTNKNAPMQNQEWARVDSGKTVLHARVFSAIYPNNAPGHFHSDTGSFTLAYNGEKIVVDGGRVNYGQEGRTYFQKNHFGHNQIAIDGKCPDITMRKFYNDEFLDYYLGKKPRISSEEDSITMTYFGGHKVSGVDSCIRAIKVKNSKVVISDTIRGKGTHLIEFPLHIAPQIEIINDRNKILIGKDGYEGKISYSENDCKVTVLEDDFKYCNYSERYGELDVCKVILFKKKVKLPFTLETTIEIKEL
jgi:hypothetical protein